MTDKQKQAILLINGLTGYLSHDEYFLLLDFIVGNNEPTLIPYPSWKDVNKKSYDPPITTIYGCPVDKVITTDNANYITKKEQ